MDLRSGSLFGTKIEGIKESMPDSNIDRKMVKNIWMAIEKRFSMFFLEEKKFLRELLEELTTMSKENAKLRDDVNNLKLFLSSRSDAQLWLSNRVILILKKYSQRQNFRISSFL